MPYYLGIDSGGTKTRCVLADENVELASAMTGGSNIVRLGEAKAREALHAGVRQVCGSARVNAAEIHAICVGAAGAGRPGIAAKMRAMVAGMAPGIDPARIEIVGDTVIALEAAFGLGAGIVVIAGTGSVAFGRDVAGNTARAGGWGFAISDKGSGHWIGREAVAAIVDAYDRSRETALARMVLEAWKLNDLDELVQHANANPAPEFPRLFPVVLDASEEGDAVARELLSTAAVRLAALASVVVERFAAGRSAGFLPIAMTGSVFRQSLRVRENFRATLQERFPGIEVRQEMVDPVEGAVARARKRP
jgi:N-acetylglucosamine kinase-like BadF-type ATPase